MKTVREDGTEVKAGDVVTDFRGHDFLFVRATRARSGHWTGKVVVVDGPRNAEREVYDTVFSLAVMRDLPASAIGEVNPSTGHLVIDQRGDVVLAWRQRDGKADYAVWRLAVASDGRRMFDAGDYYDGQGALARAALAFRQR